MTNANLVVYLQAVGGKFLGPHAYNTNEILLVFTYSGGEIKLAYNLDNNPDDGQIGSAFTVGSSSFMPILTQNRPGSPGVNYLTPDSSTICAQTPLTLSSNFEVGTLTAIIPSPNNLPQLITQYVNLSAMQQNYRVTVPVPGLLLGAVSGAAGTGNIAVTVAMMCGCKITTGLPTSYWWAGDFVVNAELVYTDGSTQTVPLSFNPVTNDSAFNTQVENAGNIATVNFTATQLSTGNVGYLSLPWQ